MWKFAGFALLLAVFCEGCVWISNQKYPVDHALFEGTPQASCVDISGTYSNVNTPVEKKPLFAGKEMLLSYLFLSDHEKIKKVVIKQTSANDLDIIGMDRDVVISEARYSADKNDFTCKGSSIVFNTKPVDTTGAMGIMFANDRKELSKTVNGELVLRTVSKGVGVILVLPMVSKESYLYFFKKLD